MLRTSTVTGTPATRKPALDAGPDPDFIVGLERGLAVITTFDDEHRHLTVTAVAERTNLSRAAARRFLYTLAQLGYVRQNGRTYELGPRVLELGAAYLAGLAAPELARPYLENLSDSVGESSHLSVLDGPEITCVAKVPVRKIWSLDIHVGTRFPAFATAAGRVLLAARSDEWLDGFLSSTDLRAITSHTTTDRTLLRRELLRIREQGWALVDQEVELQLWTVAAPVRRPCRRRWRCSERLDVVDHVADRRGPSPLCGPAARLRSGSRGRDGQDRLFRSEPANARPDLDITSWWVVCTRYPHESCEQRSHAVRRGGTMYQQSLTWALVPCRFHVAAGTTGSTTEPVRDGAYADYDGEGTVGFSIYNGVVPRWNAHDIPNLERCLAEHAPNVDLITADPQGDAAQQTSQVQSMLLDGIDVLLMTPVALTPTTIVEAAKEADVPSSGYLNPPAGLAEGDFVALVGDGPEPIGIAQGEWLLDNVEDGAKVALVNGDLATQYAVLMRDGQLSVLQPAIDDGAIELVADAGAVNWDPANSQSEAAAILVANPDIDAFIVGNDQLANGVIQALKNVGREGEVKVVALDANPIGAQDMLQGWLTATVVKSFADGSISPARQSCIC